jgi:lipopolysaccharide export LptBFGC system permease protein LptF
MLILDLEDGKIYEASLREPDRLREVAFRRYRVEIPMDTRLIQRQRSYRSDREMTTGMMWKEIQEQQRRADLTRDAEIRRASLRRIAQLWVEIHKKFAFAFAAPVFVLLGIPLAVRTRRGGFGTAFGVSFFVYVLYYLMIIAGEELGDRMMIPAWLGMWGPNLLFYALGTWMLWRYR